MSLMDRELTCVMCDSDYPYKMVAGAGWCDDDRKACNHIYCVGCLEDMQRNDDTKCIVCGNDMTLHFECFAFPELNKKRVIVNDDDHCICTLKHARVEMFDVPTPDDDLGKLLIKLGKYDEFVQDLSGKTVEDAISIMADKYPECFDSCFQDA